jgi:CheY-like chemotaxis protein/HD-like signal output (HDOD) protein
MSMVMVVDDMAMIREPIAACLKAAGFEVVCAGDGVAALAATSARVPDLILLDLAMPGMDGIKVLEALRASPRTVATPVILLTASSDKDHVVKAAKLGVRDYLLKSRFSLPDLMQRVNKYVPAKGVVAPVPKKPAPAAPPSAVKPAAAKPAETAAPRAAGTIQPLLNREQCIKRAEDAMQARTLSGVVAQVISLAASPRGDLSELAALIARDPLLSTRVLQAANSVSYASTRGVVSNVGDAVRNIGCATVRDIAAALGVFDAMPPCGADGFNPIRCWQHSFAVATLCHRMAPESEGGAAYLVGLCHDLGEILFHTHFSAEYRQVVDAQQATGKRRDELERQMLGMTHGELVQVILRKLGLPDAIRAPIEEYHAGGLAGRGGSPLVRLLRLADLYANGVLLASSAQSPVGPINRADAKSATTEDHPPVPDAMALRGEIFAMTAMLARLSAREEAELMTAPYPKRPVRLWLARDPAFSKFDPIAAVLDSLAETTVSDKLPRLAELAGYQGVVVVARGTGAAGFTAPEIADCLKTEAAPLPALWLAGRMEGSAPPDAALTPLLWPVPLGRIAEFVQGLGQTPP